MTLASQRSRPARFGFFIVAVVQFLVMAALPFTHRHPVVADDGIASVEEQGERGAPAAHTDFCVICQTLRHAQTAPSAMQVIARTDTTVSPRTDNPVTAASTTHFTSSQPRAPPV